MNKAKATNKGKIRNNAIDWYAPHYITSIPQQAILSKPTLSKVPTEFQYAERRVFMKEVNPQNFWTCELGTQENVKVPIWIFVGFQQRHRLDSQNLNIETFHRHLVTSAQCIISTEKYPDSAFFCIMMMLNVLKHMLK